MREIHIEAGKSSELFAGCLLRPVRRVHEPASMSQPRP